MDKHTKRESRSMQLVSHFKIHRPKRAIITEIMTRGTAATKQDEKRQQKTKAHLNNCNE